MNKLNHLYIHIPFCKHICTYCDFKRFIANEQDMTKYVNKVIRELNKKYRNNKFKTIYIGGGTPNSLSKTNLIKLLRTLNKHLNKDYEFTMECNPEFVTKEQTQIMKTYGVNRVSLGVQTTNEKLLEKINRKHDVRDVINAISNLRLVQINNISCDFIYGFNEMNNEDLQQDIKFIVKHKIPHVSFYSLEIKPGSVIQKHNYVCNEEHVESQFKYIIDKLKNTQFHRYEISSWSIDKKHESKHNKSYWLTNDWGAIGLGAFGFENKIYYEYAGTLTNWQINKHKYSNKDYYFQILMMGLRLIQGLDLSVDKYHQAYQFFKPKLDYVRIKNNFLSACNINLLDNVLEKII